MVSPSPTATTTAGSHVGMQEGRASLPLAAARGRPHSARAHQIPHQWACPATLHSRPSPPLAPGSQQPSRHPAPWQLASLSGLHQLHSRPRPAPRHGLAAAVLSTGALATGLTYLAALCGLRARLAATARARPTGLHARPCRLARPALGIWPRIPSVTAHSWHAPARGPQAMSCTPKRGGQVKARSSNTTGDARGPPRARPAQAATGLGQRNLLPLPARGRLAQPDGAVSLTAGGLHSTKPRPSDGPEFSSGFLKKYATAENTMVCFNI